MKKYRVFLLIAVAILLVSCAAEAQHDITPCLTGETYGFWDGLWHGMIAPITFIIGLFDKDVAMYAVNNNGNYYALGFVLGAGILIGGGTKSTN